MKIPKDKKKYSYSVIDYIWVSYSHSAFFSLPGYLLTVGSFFLSYKNNNKKIFSTSKCFSWLFFASQIFHIILFILNMQICKAS